MNELILRLSDGTVVRGGRTEIIEFLERANKAEFGVYNSSTKGTIYICDMATSHIRNAILKKTREWATNLSRVASMLSDEELVNELANNEGDVEYCNLFSELCRRAQENE